MANKPWIVMIAGPNGAGKSTFYEHVLKHDPFFKNAEFVNLDNLAKEMSEEGHDPNEYMLQAGRAISKHLEANLKKKKSFIYETTASGVTHVKLLEEARKRGFKVNTILIGLSSAELSYLRVQQRVNEGGHNVPLEDINRRYPKIIKHFPDLLKVSDVSAVFDNSGKHPFKLIFLMDESQFLIFHNYPRWLNKSLQDRKTSKELIHITGKEMRALPKEKSTKIITQIFQQLCPDNRR